MGRTTPPFRADHVGSLLRPRRLLQARHDHAAGRMSEEELRAVEDDAIHATASVFWQISGKWRSERREKMRCAWWS
jgi:methionine synthase II (cobalamin-independent)